MEKLILNPGKEELILVFIYFVLIIFILILLFIFSKIRIEIDNFEFNSQLKGFTNKSYKIYFKLYILKFIPILKIKIDDKKIRKKLKEDKFKAKTQKIEQDILSKKIQIGEFKNLDFEIKKFNLNLELGTENAFLTSMLIPIISALISILLGKKSKDVTNTKYIIKPIYINQNLIKILIFGIFDIKMFHIINILYSLIKKEGENKNERTSNRRSYDYGYE